VELFGDIDHGGAEHVHHKGREWGRGAEVGDGFSDVRLLKLKYFYHRSWWGGGGSFGEVDELKTLGVNKGMSVSIGCGVGW